MEFDFQKIAEWRLIEPSFNGQSVLEKMFGLKQFQARIPSPRVVTEREMDDLDLKFASYLKGKKVLFTPEELDEYIVY